MPNNFTKKKGSRYVCDPDKFLYNIDTFWYNADCPDYDQVIEQYIDQFEEGRNYYANTGEHLSITLPLFDLESEFQIQGGQPPAYAYSLRSNDIAIYFSKKKHDDNMPLKIQINQFLLWEKGINKAIDLTFIILSMLGFEITQAQINRIDYAIHTDQYKFMLNDMKKFHYPNNFAKSSKPNIIQADLLEGTFETITFGSRSSKRRFMRIYNKSKEIHDKNKYWFLDIYNKFNMDTKNIWNIELEIRRNFIKDLQDDELVYMFNDLFYCMNNNGFQKLFMYAIQDYGLENSTFWNTLINNKNNTFKIDGYDLQREKVNNWDKERETAQILGRLKKFVLYDDDYDLRHAISNAYEYMIDYLERTEKDFKKEVEKLKKLNFTEDILKTLKKATQPKSIEWDHRED